MAVSKSDLAGHLAIPGLLIVMLALLPLALRLDSQVDRNRPMYDDLATMEWLQHQAVVRGEEPTQVHLGPGDATVVADQEFTPSAGVTVQVRKDGKKDFCVRVSNDHGDRSSWHCYDPEEPPRNPDPDPDEAGL